MFHLHSYKLSTIVHKVLSFFDLNDPKKIRHPLFCFKIKFEFDPEVTSTFYLYIFDSTNGMCCDNKLINFISL